MEQSWTIRACKLPRHDFRFGFACGRDQSTGRGEISFQHPAIDLRRPAQWRRIFFSGRQGADFPERTRSRGIRFTKFTCSISSRARATASLRALAKRPALSSGPASTKCYSPRLTIDPDANAKQKAELDFRASGKQRRYSWDYDEQMDICSARRDGSRSAPAHRRARL